MEDLGIRRYFSFSLLLEEFRRNAEDEAVTESGSFMKGRVCAQLTSLGLHCG